MKKVKIGLGLLAAIIGIGSSAFIIKPGNYAKQIAYYWYTLGGTYNGYLNRHSSIATEESFLHSQTGLNYNTTGGTAVEDGFTVEGNPATETDPSGSMVTMYHS